MSKAVFWVSFTFVVYIYAGYPLLLLLWRAMARRPVRKGYWEPTVTIAMAVYNEAQTIEGKLINCLELDYPREKLQIIVSLDGCVDGTEAIAKNYESESIRILRCPRHGGKAVALNRAVAAARGEVVVFVDARQRVDRGAIRELVANFHDRSVGAVSGELILVHSPLSEQRQANGAVGFYWSYEKWLRCMESEIHSAVGTSGALYAIRRDRFQPLPEDTILDDVTIPMQTVLRGSRVIFEPKARVYDRMADSPKVEFGRKVRTLTGNYQLLAQMPALLNPQRNPIFLQFVSHKVGRLFVPYFLATLYVSNLFLLRDIYLAAFVLQSSWYLLAGAGALALGGFRTRQP